MTEPVIKPGMPHLAGYIEQLGVPETLEQAIAERNAWVESAAQFSRNEDYYRGLVERIGQAIGTQAHIADDGSRSQDVLCAKVPELVAALISGLREAKLQLEYLDERFPTGTTPAVLARLDSLLPEDKS